MTELQRYGLHWTGPRDFIPKPMSDGYWTPYHIAQERINELEADNDHQRTRRNAARECITALTRGKGMTLLGYGCFPMTGGVTMLTPLVFYTLEEAEAYRGKSPLALEVRPVYVSTYAYE